MTLVKPFSPRFRGGGKKALFDIWKRKQNRVMKICPISIGLKTLFWDNTVTLVYIAILTQSCKKRRKWLENMY